MILKNISYPELINILNTYTKKFIGFLLTGSSKTELDKCKSMLDSLIAELKKRREFHEQDKVREKYVLGVLNQKALLN